MPFPDYLTSKPRIIFFTDFDGTVTSEDMLDWLVAKEGYGLERLRQSSQAVMDGTMTYREASREQLESIQIGFEKCIEMAIAHAQLDEGFLAFYKWAVSANVPIVVLSGGLAPMIEATLKHFVGHETAEIEVVANSVAVREGFASVNHDGGAWRVLFRDDTVYGNDKAQAIKPYAEYCDKMDEEDRPILLRQQMPFTEFQNWQTILETTQDL
ncbi:hypothetical protein NEMBOFW57_008005 [Staphylotrichum longicolle]|uniref:Phosphoserine phosphatase n=1 Tax=Staphylotrichum longicolle TaxID=669026 RepID=A0AAD4EUC5_9PEZI|nr:hypothetical protein NEMBOFW57_008005 [Staphylotrichum longicolle]